jgi:hypothetical protein
MQDTLLHGCQDIVNGHVEIVIASDERQEGVSICDKRFRLNPFHLFPEEPDPRRADNHRQQHARGLALGVETAADAILPRR